MEATSTTGSEAARLRRARVRRLEPAVEPGFGRRRRPREEYSANAEWRALARSQGGHNHGDRNRHNSIQ
jgi:hypothetical protein